MKRNKADKELLLATEKASKISKYYNLQELRNLLNSSKPSIRLFGLQIVRNQIQKSKPIKSYFQLSKGVIEDSNNNCRWQSLIIIGEYLNDCPEEVFNIIVKYGSSNDGDMRSAIATVLLEHLLEKNFKKYFHKYKKISINNINLVDTLSKCWVNGNSPKEQKEINLFLKSMRI